MRTFNNKKSNPVYRVALMVLVAIAIFTSANAQPVEDWVKRYNNFDKEDKAIAMKMDAEGNIFVTGYSESKAGDRDILTIKYSPTGNQLWASYFDGQGNSDGKDDEGRALVLDGNGNVYVTGVTPSGVRGRDYCTIKYNEKGDQEWVSYYSGPGSIEDSDDEATGILYSQEGFIYVTGTTDGAGTGKDFCTVQYNVSGDLIWSHLFNGPANGNDLAVGIALDNNQNVLVTGISEGIVTNNDYTTIKYSSYGRELWRASYNGVGGNLAANNDEPVALAIDRFDNIFIAGTSDGAATGKDFLTVKYDVNGDEIWTSRFDNPYLKTAIRSDEEVKAMAIDEAGNIYLTGKATSSLGGSDYLTVKINEKGSVDWFKHYNSELFDKTVDGANALALDRRGNVYVTGFVNGVEPYTDCGNERGVDFGTIKYSSRGQMMWIKEFNGSGGIGSNDDIAKAIAVDGRGRIFVMGETMGDETGTDYCVIGYSEFLPVDESAAVTDKAYYVLNDNFPNPFNPTTRISFEIPEASNVKLEIFDMSGRQVAMIVNKTLEAGKHDYEWNAAQLSSGTYLYKLQTDGFVQTKKMMLIK